MAVDSLYRLRMDDNTIVYMWARNASAIYTMLRLFGLSQHVVSVVPAFEHVFMLEALEAAHKKNRGNLS